MKMFITLFALVAGVTAQAAINQATNSNCTQRYGAGKTLVSDSTTYVPPKEAKQKPATQSASAKARTQGS